MPNPQARRNAELSRCQSPCRNFYIAKNQTLLTQFSLNLHRLLHGFNRQLIDNEMTQMAHRSCFRNGISMIELSEMFPDERTVEIWFKSFHRPDQRSCGHWGSTITTKTPNRISMLYWRSRCRRNFNSRTRTTIENSRLTYRKWL